MDIICGDEDGRVALVENTGKIRNGQPAFKQPQYFQQEARDLKFGALVTPVSFDWDADGDEDLICGNTSGNIAFLENLEVHLFFPALSARKKKPKTTHHF